MSQINLNNYEAYLLDFTEGTLSEETQMELEIFLIQHPELSVDLNELSLICLNHESITFDAKPGLKKTENELISESQFIHYIEGLSDASEKSHIEKSCALNPKLQTELTFYKHTIMESDESIICPNKENLKRKPKVIWLNFNATRFAAAASVLLLLSLVFLWPKNELNKTEPELAKKEFVKTDRASGLQSAESNSLIANSKVTKPDNQQTFESLSSKQDSNASNEKQMASYTAKTNNIATVEPTNKQKEEAVNNTEEAVVHQTPEATSNHSNPSTIVEIISETDEELITQNESKKKKSIWAIAGKALKSLNTLGVKTVDGEEKRDAYALTLGGLQIKHTSAEKL